jgi:hypothetical protein
MRLRPGNDIFNEGKLSLKGHLREKALGHLQSHASHLHRPLVSLLIRR